MGPGTEHWYILLKMAASIVVNNALCFICNKLHNTPEKVLKSAIIDFYEASAITEAKRQLLNDSKDIQPVADNLPHISDRRDGVNRVTKEVDDIFQLLAWLDSQNLLINLPKYVADGPDRMPFARLYEGDLSVLMVMLGKLEGRLSNHESTVAAILRD